MTLALAGGTRRGEVPPVPPRPRASPHCRGEAGQGVVPPVPLANLARVPAASSHGLVRQLTRGAHPLCPDPSRGYPPG
eukprot:1195008-Prorocentrum_minimum.AAC.2